jgi:hypothetical protein
MVIVLASSAFATTSRVIALAGANNYLNDDSDVFRWYGTIDSYTRMVMAEAGQADNTTGSSQVASADRQALGFTHNWGEDHWLGTWGFFVLHFNLSDESFYFFNPLGNPDDDGNSPSNLGLPTTKVIVNWGKSASGVSWGVQLTNSNTEFEQTIGGTTTTTSTKFTTLGGGARVDIGQSAYLDANLDIGFASGDGAGDFENGSSFDVAARIFWEATSDATLIGVFDFTSYDFAFTADAASSGSKVTDFILGVGLDFDVNTNNTLIFSAELESFNWKPSKVATNDQDELKVFILPTWRVALESDITSWFTARVGAVKVLAKVEEIQPNGDITIQTGPAGLAGSLFSDDFSWTLGAGFHLGDWDIDAVLSDDTPFRLGYWLTGFGGDDPTPIVSRISATYRF